jgi:DNA-binding transcriptional LysR family regulator
MDLTDRVAHRLKLRDLRMLDTVVRWGSMAKAAEQLNLSQPAISKAIAEMEHVLGVRLIDRGRQGVEPTPYGAALLRRGTAIYDELRQGVAEIEHLSDPATGAVRIAAPEPMAAGLLPILIEQFTKEYPRASVHVTHTPVASLHILTPRYHDLRTRNVDLVLGPIFGPLQDDDLAAVSLYKDAAAVAAGANGPWKRRRGVALSELMEERWILQPADTIAGRSHLEAFHVAGLGAPAKLITTTSVQIQISLVASQRYLTILPASTLHFSGRRLGITALATRLKIEPLNVGIVTLKNRTISPVARQFIEMTRGTTARLRLG